MTSTREPASADTLEEKVPEKVFHTSNRIMMFDTWLKLMRACEEGFGCGWPGVCSMRCALCVTIRLHIVLKVARWARYLILAGP